MPEQWFPATPRNTRFELSSESQMCSCRKNRYPRPLHGRSLEIPRERGVLRAKIVEALYEDKPEFPGGRGGCKTKTFHGVGSTDIFWKCTIQHLVFFKGQGGFYTQVLKGATTIKTEQIISSNDKI